MSTSRDTSARLPPRRHWASAECSESTGTIWPGAAARVTSVPPATSDSLLASARVAPLRSAASVGARPAGTGDSVEHHVGGLGRDELGRRLGTDQDPGHPVAAPVVPASLRLGEQRQLQILRRPAAGHCHSGCAGRQHLRGQRLRVRTSSGEPDHAETIGVALDHVQCLDADRPGAAEQQHRAWPI